MTFLSYAGRIKFSCPTVCCNVDFNTRKSQQDSCKATSEVYFPLNQNQSVKLLRSTYHFTVALTLLGHTERRL